MATDKRKLKDEVNELQDVTVSDFLSGFDSSIRLLLERNYLDEWPREWNMFAKSRSRTNWEDALFGFRLRGMRHYGKKEQELALQNIENVLSLFRDGSHSFLTAISGGKNAADIMFLACEKEQGKESVPTKGYAEAMEKSWRANFSGSVCENISIAEYDQLAEKFRENECLGVMTGIPGRKRPDEEFFAQGIERLLDTVAGLDFQILTIAEPLSLTEINQTIDQVLALKNQIGLFYKETLNESSTVSQSLTKTIGAYGGGSLADSKAWTFGLALVIVATRAATETAGKMAGGFASLSSTKTHALTKGTAREVVNYAVENALGILDEYLERLKYARSYGFWKTGIYLSAPDRETYLSVKNAMFSQFSGENSSLEPLRFVDLDFTREGESKASAIERKRSFVAEMVSGFNPELTFFTDIRNAIEEAIGEELPFSSHPLGDIFNGLYTPMTTGELAILVAPPQRECRSVSVTERGAFGGKRVLPPKTDGLRVGETLYYGNCTGESLYIPFKELPRHMFVCGTTGSGKTNTVKQFCKQFADANIPWLVIEPGIKTEYGNLELEDGSFPLHFSLGSNSEATSKGMPFRMNPFYFPKGIDLLTHVDRLKASFNAAFPMYASMPYILEEAILAIYKDRGWNVLDGCNIHADDPWHDAEGELLFPLMSQLLDKIDSVVEKKRYDIRLQMDISAALKARISSLLQGGKGSMLNTQHSFPMETVLSSPTVMDMAGIGSQEEKALVMAFMFTAVFEHASLRTPGRDLEKPDHILVIEEAHNLLKNTQTTDNPEIANIRGSAVEQFATMLAELRGLAEGVVVVDQIPTTLIPDVIKNTNLKVVHQLCAEDDRNLVGNAMLLDQNQKDELGRLNRNRGEAAVYHPLWEKTYSVSVEKVETECIRGNNKAVLIKQYASVYGENPYSTIKTTKDYGTSLARILYGLAFKDVKMISLGINAIHQKPIVGRALNDRCAILNNQKALFEECIINILHVSGGKLQLLSECPDRFENLMDACLAKDPESAEEYMKDLHLFFDELDGAEGILLDFAARKYLTAEGLQSTAHQIGEKFSGDQVYERLRKKTLEHVKRICGEHFSDYAPQIEESLVRQFMISSGFLFNAEIVENYNHRFLS